MPKTFRNAIKKGFSGLSKWNEAQNIYSALELAQASSGAETNAIALRGEGLIEDPPSDLGA